jgi:catechol 2,3-dioxygenase-like lactoylglutathione lyase family enzyme
MKTVFHSASPYQASALTLPVADLEKATPFYETVMGFQVVSLDNSPYPSAILGRDAVQIGLVQNGGDPTQDGCFFEVNDVEAAFAELKASGLMQDAAGFRLDRYGETSYRVFFVVAPDGLCYCLGERQG